MRFRPRPTSQLPVPVEPKLTAENYAPGTIPDHVWRLLGSAGEAAAVRLQHMLTDHDQWAALKQGERLRLVELAMNRAYGPPVKREVKLTGKLDADAVQASLSRLSDAMDLPEYRGAGSAPANAAQDGRKRY